MNEELEQIIKELQELAYTPFTFPESEWYNGKFAIAVQFSGGDGEAKDKAELSAFAKKHNMDYLIDSRTLPNGNGPEEVVILRQWTKSA